MTYQVEILEGAEQDMKELRAYILRKFGRESWKDSYAKLKTSVLNLEKFPYSGSTPEEMEELNLSQYQQVISGQNRIIYEVRQKTVYVHIIADTRKDMKTLLTNRLLRTLLS